MTTYSASVTNRKYTSGSVPDHPHSILNAFLPTGEPNENGWPVHVEAILSGFYDSELFTTITAESHPKLHALLEKKHAVVTVALPVARGSNSGNSELTVAYDPANNLYGPAYRGNGVHVDPEAAMPAGIVTGVHPYQDPLWFMSTKHYGMALQYVQHTLAAELNLDTSLATGGGASAGCYAVLHCFWGPDRAPQMFPGGTGQDAQPTNYLKAVLCDWPQVAWLLYDPSFAALLFPQVPGTGSGYLVNNASGYAPGATTIKLDTGTGTIQKGDLIQFAGHARIYRVATALGGGQLVLSQGLDSAVANNEAVTLIKGWDWPSPALSLVDHDQAVKGAMLSTATQPAVLAANMAKHAYLAYEQPGTAGAPYDLTNESGDETQVHSRWHGDAAKLALGDGVYLAAFDPDIATGNEDAVLADEAALRADQVARLAEWLPYTWTPTPIEEAVLQQVEFVLEGITAAAGYATDVRVVRRWEEWSESAGEYPAVLVEALGASYDDASFHGHDQGTLTIGLALLLEGHTDRTARVSRFIADVRKALQAAFLADQLAQLSVDLRITGSQRITTQLEELAVCGASLTVEVTYRNSIQDTYQR